MDAKAAAREQVATHQERLIALSHRIHAHPELGYEEEKASAWLAEELAGAGFAVETGICDLPTAFRARAGSGPLHLAICAEYDCLPAIGHACGHNIIAAMAVGAGIAAAKVADDVGLTVTVLGTPAEEVGNVGGKIVMLERGAFDGMHAAMMVHPYPVDMVTPHVIAAALFEIAYTGKEAHASAFPELGVNAGDALTIAQVAIGLLRQHIGQTDRVHGIITKGGDAPNVIPAHTNAKYMIRADTLDQLQNLAPKVRRYHRRREALRACAARCRHGGALPAQRRGVGADARRIASGSLHRHGQRLPGHADHPPGDRHQFAAGGEPSAGVHGALRHPGRRSGAAGRRRRHGLDGDRHGW